MRQIYKRAEPVFWRQFRKEKGAAYNITWMPKQQLRESLAQEQGFLCCYCLSRISPSEHEMKVEHWEPQSERDDLQIDYENLLGACPGGEGSPPSQQHCDTAKKNAPLRIHPARRGQDCGRLFRYLADGTIASTSEDAQHDIGVLNLNLEGLRRQRQAVLDALRSWLEREFPGRTVDAATLLARAKEWDTPDAQGRLSPFCQVAIYWLQKHSRGR